MTWLSIVNNNQKCQLMPETSCDTGWNSRACLYERMRGNKGNYDTMIIHSYMIVYIYISYQWLEDTSKGMKTMTNEPSLVVIMLSRPSGQESVKSWTLSQMYLQHAAPGKASSEWLLTHVVMLFLGGLHALTVRFLQCLHAEVNFIIPYFFDTFITI